jgi:regulator of protease activity HflC (stomatin/prohibitin superfamily)
MSPAKSVGIVFVFIILVAVLVASGKLIEYVDSNEIVIIQYPSGGLRFATSAGPYAQWFGSVETYKRREQFAFEFRTERKQIERIRESSDGKPYKVMVDTDVELAGSQAMKIRFNDNGHGKIGGTIDWEMPSEAHCLQNLFERYRTQDAVETQLIRPTLERSIYMSGPLMSSTESAAERRAELLQIIEDQIDNGIFARETIQEEQIDTITKEKHKVNVIRLLKNADGTQARQAESPLKEFCIKTFNLTLNNIQYDPEVEEQIQLQQKAIMNVRIAMANAKKSEQDALTAVEKGKAEAATAKWEQEKLNAQTIAQADGQRRAADLKAQAAKFYKDEQLLLADADAGYRKKIMEADNALEKRLETYVKTQEVWANAMANAKHPLVPQVQTGGAGGNSNAATTFMELLTSKAAKDLQIDLQKNR